MRQTDKQTGKTRNAANQDTRITIQTFGCEIDKIHLGCSR